MRTASERFEQPHEATHVQQATGLLYCSLTTRTRGDNIRRQLTNSLDTQRPETGTHAHY
jgi:hypothetical protein